MDKDEIKRQVNMERLLGHYGRIPVAGKKMQCLSPENHNNNDANPSMDVYKDRVFCRSQGCFGDKGADIFEVVGLKENLSRFPYQKAWIEATFGLTNGKPKKIRFSEPFNGRTQKAATLTIYDLIMRKKNLRGTNKRMGPAHGL